MLVELLLRGELLWTICNSTRNCINFVPVSVLDVLVSAGCVEPFLWAERTWYIFMFLNVNFKTSLSRAVYITFTTSETCACRANVRLACSSCVSRSHCIITTGAGHFCFFRGVDILGSGLWCRYRLGCCWRFLVVFVNVDPQGVLVLESTVTKIAQQMITLAND